MMCPLAVVFNMTARSGKDTAVNHLMTKYPDAAHLSFKEKLLEATLGFFGIDREVWNQRYDAPFDKISWMKDIPWEGYLEINGRVLSQREALIHVSENVIKPSIGKDAFGVAVAKQIQPNTLTLISDGGFNEELEPIIHVAEVLILQRDRLGTNWKGDSRHWLSHDLATIRYCPAHIQDEAEYLAWVEEQVDSWLNPDY